MEENQLENYSLLSEEELASLKDLGLEFSQEDLEIMTEANSIVETIDMLPEDEDYLFNEIEDKIPDTDNADVGVPALTKLVETNPELFKQIMALYETVNLVKELDASEAASLGAEPTAKVEKLDASALQAAKDEELKKVILGYIKSAN